MTMGHYSMEKWVDFVRNVIGERERGAMQSHLEDGCKECSMVLRLWQHVNDAARHEHSYQPPDSAVRSMKGTFAIQGPRRARRRTPTIVSLLFDSFLNPQAAGTRSATTTARQLLYAAGCYRIDVRIEPQIDSDNISLVGQVLNSANPGGSIGEVPVALIRGQKVLARTVTSKFGEFHLESDTEGGFQLRVNVLGEDLRLPVIEPVSEGTDSKRVNSSPPRTKKRTRKKA
jgi:hypothetical protein